MTRKNANNFFIRLNVLFYVFNATCMDKTLNMYFNILIVNNLITLNRTYNCLPIALMILHSCCKGCETVAIVIPLRQENYCCSQSEWLVCKLHQWPNVFFISLTTKACHILNVSQEPENNWRKKILKFILFLIERTGLKDKV